MWGKYHPEVQWPMPRDTHELILFNEDNRDYHALFTIMQLRVSELRLKPHDRKQGRLWNSFTIGDEIRSEHHNANEDVSMFIDMDTSDWPLIISSSSSIV